MIKCTCGKAIDVKDEAAGTAVVCQACGREVHVPGASGPAGAVPEAPSVPLPQAAPDTGPSSTCPFCAERIPSGSRSCPLCHEAIPAPGSSIACPACAERIPSGLSSCPLCGEAITAPWSQEEQKRLLAERIVSLENHAKDMQAQFADKALKAGFLSAKTIVVGVFLALGILMICIGGSASQDSEAWIFLGVMTSLGFGIPVLVSLANDYRAFHIQDASSPLTAFKRFFSAVQTGRAAKAYVSLAPEARVAGEVKSVTFENPKIPSHTGSYSIRDVPTFKAYWKSIFKGPSMQTRTVRLKTAKMLHEGSDGLAVLEAQVEFTNYPTLYVFLLGILLVLLVQKHETKTVRKLLLNRGGRWYLAEGELEGPLDRMEL